MWSWLASLIGGPAITGLINAYKAKLDGEIGSNPVLRVRSG
jgi:hypothetical protein